MKRLKLACHRLKNNPRRRNSMSFFPINPADVAKRLGGVSKRIFRRGRVAVGGEGIAYAMRPVRCDGAHTNARA